MTSIVLHHRASELKINIGKKVTASERRNKTKLHSNKKIIFTNTKYFRFSDTMQLLVS